MVGERFYFCMPPSLIQNLDNKYHLKHFAWVIVLIASIIQMVGSTIRNVFGVMVEPMSDTFGWSQGEIGLGYAIAALCTAFFSPVAGILGDIFGAKRTMIFGTVLFLIGTKLDLVRITFTLNIWPLKTEEKKRQLSHLSSTMPSIDNQQY